MLFSMGGKGYANGKHIVFFKYILHATRFSITIVFKFDHTNSGCTVRWVNEHELE
jgi:hypothetical protein